MSGDSIFRLLLFASLAWLMPACNAPASTGAPTAAPSPLVQFSRTGGFAGVNDHLTIGPNRQATLTQKSGQSQFEIDQQTYDQLRQQLEQVGFAKLKPDYPAPPGAADVFTYTVTYQGQTVRAQDTAVPASLQPVVSTLNGIVQAHGKR